MLTLAIVLLCIAPIVGFLFAPEEFPRLFCAIWLTWVIFSLEAMIAVCIVAVHFANKYW